MRASLPLPLRTLAQEVEERLAQVPSFGMHPRGIGTVTLILAACIATTSGSRPGASKTSPLGRMVLVANHAGNTLPMDGAMLGQAMLLGSGATPD